MADKKYTYEFPPDITEGDKFVVFARLLDENGKPALRVGVQFYLDGEPYPDEDPVTGTKVPDGIPQYTRSDGIARVEMEVPSAGPHAISVRIVGSTHEEAFHSNYFTVKERKTKSPAKKRIEEVTEELELHEKEQELAEARKPKVETPTAKKIEDLKEQKHLVLVQKDLRDAKKIERPSRLEQDAARLKTKIQIAQDKKHLADAEKALNEKAPVPEVVELYALREGPSGARKLRVLANTNDRKPILGLKGKVDFADGTSRGFEIAPKGYATVDPPAPFTQTIWYEVIAGTKTFRGILVP